MTHDTIACDVALHVAVSVADMLPVSFWASAQREIKHKVTSHR